MTNDAKLWGWRVIVFIMFSIDGSVLAKAVTPSGAQHAISATWFVIFFVLCVANVPVYILYQRARIARWKGSAHKSPEQLQVEILAAAAKNGVLPPKKPAEATSAQPTAAVTPGAPPVVAPAPGALGAPPSAAPASAPTANEPPKAPPSPPPATPNA
ncbi:MAG TPA: hypothetical protein VLF62_03005 [Candidatus Saccharimonadales bacterium]|nr:hypothetical protein [Candidatus Saccharimonadales bacterium]